MKMTFSFHPTSQNTSTFIPFRMLYLWSIGMDQLTVELCYKGTIVQRNYRKGHFMVKKMRVTR